MNRVSPQTRSTDPEHRRTARLLVLVTFFFVLVGMWTIRPDAVRAAVDRMESLLGRKTDASHEPPAPIQQPAKPNSGI
ncbi:MAG TPA: hypothetical protein VMI93_07415 [Candidatus Solibacter sp.]|nr:hypothetical protein [Candidatus Solibacter sp.]